MAIAADLYGENRNFLWGLCYRMTGSTADAEEVVQETFVRVLEKPPRNTKEPLRPWLVRVAMNLSRDLLRRRRKTEYVGPWLPAPVTQECLEDTAIKEPEARPADSPATRYDLIESVSVAFMLAMEALTPAQRAVLLLRDVFDYSTAETAKATGITEANVKVTLHRARRVMNDYDKERIRGDATRQAKTQKALEKFLRCLTARDAGGLEQLLTEDVVVISDGGGEVTALLKPMQGREKVMRLVTQLYEQQQAITKTSFCVLNGQPSVLVERSEVRPGHASRFTMQCELDHTGRICRINYVFAPSKLTALKV